MLCAWASVSWYSLRSIQDNRAHKHIMTYMILFILICFQHAKIQIILEFHTFVKIIHKKKSLRKVAFWKRGTTVLTSCLSGSLEIDIESKWVYSHIKLSFSISCVLF